MHEINNHIVDCGYLDPKEKLNKAIKELEEEYEKEVDIERIDYYDIESVTDTGKHFESKKDATEYLYSRFDDSCRSSYKCTYTLPGNSRLETLRTRLHAEEKKLEDYSKAHSVTAFKADFIGCPDCKSKLSKKRLSKMAAPNECPLCGAELRSETTINTIERYRQNIRTLSKDIVEEQKRLIQSGTRKSKYDKKATLVLVSVDTHV